MVSNTLMNSKKAGGLLTKCVNAVSSESSVLYNLD